jgi:hypothetical protein
MSPRSEFALLVAGIAALSFLASPPAPALACCPAPLHDRWVVNADQSVIIIWDAATQTQHFIRKANFKTDGDHFGFLVPSPSQPELSESGNEAFPYLSEVTAPEVVRRLGMPRLGCGAMVSSAPGGAPSLSVHVLEEKLVAGFHAAVLEASSADALVGWLKEHGYAYSPEIAAWARPYVEAGWKITALKVAKEAREETGRESKTVAASSLRMSFKTDRPLFPYREPDTKRAAESLHAVRRTLRIYFIAEARYKGELTRTTPWTGRVVWSSKLNPEQRAKTLALLKLPANTGPAAWWLTEFEDNWPYRVAPADLTFVRDPDQRTVKRPRQVEYVSAPGSRDVMVCAIGLVLAWPVFRRVVVAGKRKRHVRPC